MEDNLAAMFDFKIRSHSCLINDEIKMRLEYVPKLKPKNSYMIPSPMNLNSTTQFKYKKRFSMVEKIKNIDIEKSLSGPENYPTLASEENVSCPNMDEYKFMETDQDDFKLDSFGKLDDFKNLRSSEELSSKGSFNEQEIIITHPKRKTSSILVILERGNNIDIR